MGAHLSMVLKRKGSIPRPLIYGLLIRDFIELVSIFLGSRSLGTQLSKHSCRLHDQFQVWFTLNFRVLSLLLPFVGSL